MPLPHPLPHRYSPGPEWQRSYRTAKRASVRLATAAGTGAGLLVLSGCSAAPSTLAPQGPGAREIANVWWILFGLAMAVYAGVLIYMFIALRRPTQTAIDDEVVQRRAPRIILVTGVIIPAIILLGVLAVTIHSLRVLAAPDTAEEVTIHVIGNQWWWEIRYPQQGFVTANEMHIPAGQPVRVVLTSDDVIHSFWVPSLQGKLDLVPGQTNTMWLQADEPGVYWGLCAEFCGTQHAKMQFVVVAMPWDEYTAWLEQQRQPAREPADALARQGLQVFLEADCIQCHRIRGTAATGDLGPDLTHLASRRTLAAGAVPNTLGTLGGWITNPQHIKPGALMPAGDITGPELQALLAYLEGLH